jgi:hypothetical protein
MLGGEVHVTAQHVMGAQVMQCASVTQGGAEGCEEMLTTTYTGDHLLFPFTVMTLVPLGRTGLARASKCVRTGCGKHGQSWVGGLQQGQHPLSGRRRRLWRKEPSRSNHAHFQHTFSNTKNSNSSNSLVSASSPANQQDGKSSSPWAEIYLYRDSRQLEGGT